MSGIKLVPGFGFPPANEGGSGTPGGVNQDIQFNDNGAFGGEHTDGITTPGMTWDKVLGAFTVIAKSPGGSCAMQAGPTAGAGFQVSDTILKVGTEQPNLPISIQTSDATSDIDIESGGNLQLFTDNGNIGIEAHTSVDIEADGGNATLQSDTGTAQVVGALALLQGNAGTATVTATGDATLESTGADAIIDGAGSVALQNGGVIALVTQESTGTPKIGFLGANPTARITVTGSRASGAALQSLLTALATLGLITDGTTV